MDIPTERLDSGVFPVTEANVSVAYGDEWLLFGGVAAFEIPEVGSGLTTALREVIEEKLSFAFVNPATVPSVTKKELKHLGRTRRPKASCPTLTPD